MDYGDAAKLAGGVGSVLAGIKWMFGKKGARLDRLEREVRGVNSRLSLVGAALSSVATELRHHAPTSPALELADRALRAAFPVDPELPSDLRSLAERIGVTLGDPQ